jgi:hypothetical protein
LPFALLPSNGNFGFNNNQFMLTLSGPAGSKVVISASTNYATGTNPTNASSVLRITAESVSPGGTNGVTLTWSGVPTRFYYVQKIPNEIPL